jgi:heat shock protein HslJ
MIKGIKLWIVLLMVVSCKTSITAQKEEPSPAYKQQMENVEHGIYFRGLGNEPEWSLKISEEKIEFTSLKPGCENFTSPHVEPIRAMDANIKMYHIAIESGKMNIEISQQECVNTMSGDKKPYTVRIEMTNIKTTTKFNGCGSYVTDARLHDIWVLEKLKGATVSPTEFKKENPRLEINSTNNNFMGYAGCNQMNGTIFFERGLVRFTNIITTRMACPGNNKEAEFLQALQSATSYKVENLKLTLSNPNGELLVFRKVD